MSLVVKSYFLRLFLMSLSLPQESSEFPLSSQCSAACSNNKKVKCMISRKYMIPSSISTKAAHTEWPAAPSDMQVTEIIEITNQVRLNLTWKFPDDASYITVTGFYLEVLTEIGSHYNVFFNLSEIDWKQVGTGPHEIIFHYDCLPLFDRDGAEVFILLQSIPLPEDNFLTDGIQIIHELSQIPRVNSSVEFVSLEKKKLHSENDLIVSTFINKTNHSKCCHSIDVKLQQTAKSTTAEKYRIMLVDITDNRSIKRTDRLTDISEETVLDLIFNDVCAGEYKVVIFPFKENQVCHNCRSPSSGIFQIPSDNTCPSKLKGHNFIFYCLLAVIVFSLILVITVLLLIVHHIKSNKRRHQADIIERETLSDNVTIQQLPQNQVPLQSQIKDIHSETGTDL